MAGVQCVCSFISDPMPCAQAEVKPAADAQAEAQAAAKAQAKAEEAKALEVATVEASDNLVTFLQKRNVLSPVLLMGVRLLDELVECTVDELKGAGISKFSAAALLKAAQALVNVTAAEVCRLHCCCCWLLPYCSCSLSNPGGLSVR